MRRYASALLALCLLGGGIALAAGARGGVFFAQVAAAQYEYGNNNNNRNNNNNNDNNNEAEPELVVTQSLQPDPPLVGQRATYTLTVSNRGDVTANNVRVLDALPSNATVQSSDPACNVSGQSLVCTVGSLGDGQSRSFNIVVIFRSTGEKVNQVSADSDETGMTGTSVLSTSPRGSRPVLGKSGFVSVVSGVVYILDPGSNTYRQLLAGELVPFGVTIDVRRGRIRLTTVGPGGVLQSADFFQGVFRLTQSVGPPPVTELRLVGGSFASCQAQASTAKGSWVRSLQLLARPPVRRLWGSGKGRFRTRGRAGAATVRGTVWLTQDRCDGTWVGVRSGIVIVYDYVKRRAIIVRRGQHYLARLQPPSPG